MNHKEKQNEILKGCGKYAKIENIDEGTTLGFDCGVFEFDEIKKNLLLCKDCQKVLDKYKEAGI